MHIGRCKGCCVGAVSEEEYGGWIAEIVSLLKGGVGDIIKHYKQEMQRAAEELDFETAQVCKERIEALQQHYSKSIVSAAGDRAVDVFSLVTSESDA